jgi:hypothetical protein
MIIIVKIYTMKERDKGPYYDYIKVYESLSGLVRPSGE